MLNIQYPMPDESEFAFTSAGTVHDRRRRLRLRYDRHYIDILVPLAFVLVVLVDNLYNDTFYAATPALIPALRRKRIRSDVFSYREWLLCGWHIRRLRRDRRS